MSNSYAVLTANAGLLLCIKGKKILIDALHGERTPQFSSVSLDVQKTIINGEGDFSHIDYMIITHDHPDHVSAVLVNRFLKFHPETRVFAPMRNIFCEHMNHLMLPSENYNFDGDSFYFRRAIHEGVEFKNVINYTGIICIDGITISFFGDAAADKTLVTGEFKNTDFDISIYNFPFITLSRGREIVRAMNPKECIICHLPFEHDDINGYIPIVKRAYSKYELTLPPMHIMARELQKAEILK